jgi:endonuclease/exonuclease/phosphatase family metal-dependent hydrolase
MAAVMIAACGRTAPVTTPAPAAAPALVVVSWNMGAGRGDLEALAARLAPQPFVLLLQEADSEALLRFARKNSLSLLFEPVRTDIPGSRGNAIVASIPLADRRRIDLPRERQPRMAVAAEIELAAERLFVVSAHLENRVSWWRGGLLSENARGRQTGALLAALPAHQPGILGGDLNTWLGIHEPAWQALNSRFPDTPRRHQPTFRERLILDHLFYELPDRWRAETTVVPNTFGSDHQPVVGRVWTSD